ncbi:hypothetical protein ACWDCC_43570 [Streptomyces sp. NPDC001102]
MEKAQSGTIAGDERPDLAGALLWIEEAEHIGPKRGERWHPETVRRMLANPGDQPPTLRRRIA